jgi:predicted ATPase
LAFADADARIVERRRLTRTAFAKALDNLAIVTRIERRLIRATASGRKLTIAARPV